MSIDRYHCRNTAPMSRSSKGMWRHRDEDEGAKAHSLAKVKLDVVYLATDARIPHVQ